jgi:hypothetical protein
MPERNDKLWHDTHDAHRDNALVKLINGETGDIIGLGYVTEITGTYFVLQDLGNLSRDYRYNNLRLRIER